MNLLERYIRHQEQKSAKRSLLQTYLVSLISLCLCVTMLLGTTMAWFTTNVEVSKNQIYVGTLKVDLQLMDPAALTDGESEPAGISLVADEKGNQTEVFGDDIIWRAGLVQVRTFKIVDNGDIPFNYYLSLYAPADEQPLVVAPQSGEAEQVDEAEFLKYFEVYAHVGDAKGFQDDDLLNETQWQLVGTLDELLETETDKTCELEVFRGGPENMTAPKAQNGEKIAPSAVHSIAIKLSEEAGDAFDFGGYGVNFGIKLVASQIGSPQQINDADKLAELLEQGCSVRIPEDVTALELSESLVLDHVLLSGWMDEEGNTLSLTMDANMGNAPAITTTGGTIRYLKLMGADYKVSKIISTGDKKLTQNLYIDNVVIDGALEAIRCTGDGSSKVQVTNSNLSGAVRCENVSSLDFVSCTLGDTQSADGSLTLCGDTTFTACDLKGMKLSAGDLKEAVTVTFTDCTIDGKEVTPENFLAQLGVSGTDGNDWSKCTFIIDGAVRTIK